MSLFSFMKPTRDVSVAFSLDGIEKVVYGQTDLVLDRLQIIGAALSYFPLKKEAAEPSIEWAYKLTDGMTSDQAQEAFDGVISLMETLKNGSEGPFNADGMLTTTAAGAAVTMKGFTTDFPFRGVSERMPGGRVDRRLAERSGDRLHLRLFVEDGDELASTVDWNVDKATGRISFSLKEARYWQIKDYGRVLLNQVIEANGKIGT
ncbi:hypothetical protein [Paraburkholderia sp. BR14320]|uniref:hypothetical protein n=1 Tax=unclassified Paraburkholderia TaxID=2615204 RepID=UPI0034CF1868